MVKLEEVEVLVNWSKEGVTTTWEDRMARETSFMGGTLQVTIMGADG
jgi:hypothetical protein